MVQRGEDEGRVKAGSGSQPAQTVEERARELALIEHPESLEPNEEDRRRAHEELLGHNMPTTGDATEATRSVTRDPAEPPVLEPSGVPEVHPEDPQQELERIVEEGEREAEHQRMLEERRLRRAADEAEQGDT